MDKPRFGTLVVVVDRARNLPNRKKIGKQDAYAIVRLGHEVQRTPTDKRAGQVPSWNHEVRFQVPNEAENILKISVFNEDHKVPDLIGDCAIDLTDLYKKHEYDNWFDLKYKDKPAGEIYAELTFYYEGPPRPTPKVDIPSLQGNGRPQSAGPTGRNLPNIPATSEAMRPPQRQRTMSPTGRLSEVPRSHDLVDGLGQMSIRASISGDDFGYTNSPYQEGVRYAETWTGERDPRMVTPGPGDVRRKSFSADPRAATANYSTARYSDERYVQNVSPRRNSYMEGFDRRPQQQLPNLHRYAASQSSFLQDRFHAERTGATNHYRQQSPPTQRMAHSRQHSPTHVGRQDDHEQIQYVDPILDPRHGSPHELRGSPSIVSPRPDYPVSERYDSPPAKSHHHDQYNGYGPRDFTIDQDSYPPSQTVHGSPDLRRTNRHTQAQSMSYAPGQSRGQVGYSQAQAYHNKAASTSAMYPQGHPNFSPVQAGEGNYRTARDGRNSIDRPAYAQDVPQQRPNTYAVTPAQYAAQNRPLPMAPDAPPSRPAKIPLGLTQEEYDILYGR